MYIPDDEMVEITIDYDSEGNSAELVSLEELQDAEYESEEDDD